MLCVLIICSDCIVIEYIGYEVKLMIDERKYRESLIKERLLFFKKYIEILNYNKLILFKCIIVLLGKEEIIKK